MSAFLDVGQPPEPRRYPPGDDFAPRVISSLAAALRLRWWLVAAITLVCAAAAAAISSRTHEQYETSARIFLDGTSLGANGADPVADVLTQSKLAMSSETIALVARDLRLGQAAVAAQLSTEAASSGNYFTVSGTGNTPQSAVALVQAAEKAYQRVVTQQRAGVGTALLAHLVSQRAAAQAAYNSAQQKLAAAPRDLQLQARVAVLGAQLRALSTEEANAFTAASTPTNPVLLAEQPPVPSAPSTPQPKRDALLGGIFGTLLSIAIVWWRSSRRTTRSRTDVYTATGIVRLVELPELARSRWSRQRTSAASRDRGFVRAVSAIDVAMPDGLKVLLIMPCRQGDLAPEVATGLARAFGRNRHVVLFDGNTGDRALTHDLARRGAGQPETSIRLAAGLVGLRADAVLGTALFVPAPELADGATRCGYSSLLAELSKTTDLLLVVGPPVATSPAELLAPSADAVVIVGRNDTPWESVRETRDHLTSLGRSALGLILDQSTDSNNWRRAITRSPRPSGNHRHSKR
ncbi:MAG: hypothetical protein ACR2KJ_17840 [Jatrophihabitans sp.]